MQDIDGVFLLAVVLGVVVRHLGALDPSAGLAGAFAGFWFVGRHLTVDLTVKPDHRRVVSGQVDVGWS